VTSYCPTCKLNSSLENSKNKKKVKGKEENYVCAQCKGECELVYQLRLFVKDPST